MRRIGILSYPLNNNYGCHLQAYALFRTLENMGFDVVYINRRHDKPGVRTRLRYFINSLKMMVLYGQFRNPIYRYEWEYMEKQGKEMLSFFNSNIPHTKSFYTSKSLSKNCQSFDAIIVGSDQVWRAGLLKSIEDYFLSFVNNPHTKRIAYAASFGKEEPGYSEKQIVSCGELISLFDAVSVRESFGIRLIKKFGWNCSFPKVVLDPTLLLEKESYLALCGSSKEKTPKIFCYILDVTDEKKQIVETVEKELKIKAVNFLKGNESRDFVYPAIHKWLEAFRDSKFVITDSFHGTVFSIIFNVPFLVIGNVNRGSERMSSLLKTVGLESRLVNGKEHVKEIVDGSIDWNAIERKVAQQRQMSLDFLKSSLKGI